MRISDIPGKLAVAFAQFAGGGFIRPIPTASQIGVTDGAASLHDGFVPKNAQPISAGGVPPDIRDMNGILYEISAWTRWTNAGGPVFFDAVFAADVGGYPEGAIVQSAAVNGKLFCSKIDNNSTDPDADATNWSVIAQPATSSGAPSLTNPGYFILPNVGDPTKPFIVQWGSFAFTSESNIAFNWPIPFPNAFLWMSPGMSQTNNSGKQDNVTLEGIVGTRFGWSAHCGSGSDHNPMRLDWLAFGF